MKDTEKLATRSPGTASQSLMPSSRWAWNFGKSNHQGQDVRRWMGLSAPAQPWTWSSASTHTVNSSSTYLLWTLHTEVAAPTRAQRSTTGADNKIASTLAVRCGHLLSTERSSLLDIHTGKASPRIPAQWVFDEAAAQSTTLQTNSWPLSAGENYLQRRGKAVESHCQPTGIDPTGQQPQVEITTSAQRRRLLGFSARTFPADASSTHSMCHSCHTVQLTTAHTVQLSIVTLAPPTTTSAHIAIHILVVSDAPSDKHIRSKRTGCPLTSLVFFFFLPESGAIGSAKPLEVFMELFRNSCWTWQDSPEPALVRGSGFKADVA